MSEALLCRHFGTCGGCLSQDMPDDVYRESKRMLVVEALAEHGLESVDVANVVAVAPGTRRRANFKATRTAAGVALGFHARQSHDVVALSECRVLTPRLFALVPRLRALCAAICAVGETADIAATETLTGADIALRRKQSRARPTAAVVAQALGTAGIARLIIDGEIAMQLATPEVAIGKARVALPPDAFLQPTAEGESVLQALVRERVGKSKAVADLFAGCGTFSLVLAERARVHAVEHARPQIDALAAAARGTQGLKPVTVEVRDLFRIPVSAPELARFDAVVLDPPRAGALSQCKAFAASGLAHVVYVSCSPDSFARDARVLTGAGFRLGTVLPVDQFLWSSHIELVAAFERS